MAASPRLAARPVHVSRTALVAVVVAGIVLLTIGIIHPLAALLVVLSAPALTAAGFAGGARSKFQSLAKVGALASGLTGAAWLVIETGSESNPLAVLIGAILLALLPRRAALGTLIAGTLALVATTQIADWGRVPFGARWFEARAMPIVEADGLVLITTGEAVSYCIPMLPPSSRYVGLLNTLVKPYHGSLLTREVQELIRNHKGEFYQLTYLGLNVAAELGGRLEHSTEGTITARSLHAVGDALMDPDEKWVPTAKLYVLLWLALGAPTFGDAGRYDSAEARALYGRWLTSVTAH